VNKDGVHHKQKPCPYNVMFTSHQEKTNPNATFQLSQQEEKDKTQSTKFIVASSP